MNPFGKIGLLLALLTVLPGAACSTAAGGSKTAAYSDPFAYCAAVGTIDTPDARYTGPKMPDVILQGMIQQGLVSADAPVEFQKNAVWRCMDSQVWVCNFGANIPCEDKADTLQTPTAAMQDFCQANPAAETIPASVTGHATIYEWKCSNGTAAVGRQLLHVDGRGYPSEFWHQLSPK